MEASAITEKALVKDAEGGPEPVLKALNPPWEE